MKRSELLSALVNAGVRYSDDQLDRMCNELGVLGTHVIEIRIPQQTDVAFTWGKGDWRLVLVAFVRLAAAQDDCALNMWAKAFEGMEIDHYVSD